MVNKRFCLYSVSLIQFVNLSKQSSIGNLRVLRPKLYCRRQKNLGIPYIPQKIGKFLGRTWRLTADEYRQKCTCRRIRRRTKANANLEISKWTKMSCTTVQLQIFSVFSLTNLEKSSKIDKKSAMQKLRVFTAISQNNCIALFNLVAAAGFEPTTFGLWALQLLYHLISSSAIQSELQPNITKWEQYIAFCFWWVFAKIDVQIDVFFEPLPVQFLFSKRLFCNITNNI